MWIALIEYPQIEKMDKLRVRRSNRSKKKLEYEITLHNLCMLIKFIKTELIKFLHLN